MKNLDNRVKYIDILFGVSVILTLIYGMNVFGAKVNNVINIICPSIFFVGFGALYRSSIAKSLSPEEYIKKAFSGLIVPYVIFGLVGMARDSVAILAGWQEPDIIYLKHDAFNILSLKGTYYTGFLTMFFIATISYVLIRKKAGMVCTSIISLIAFCYVIYAGINSEVLTVDTGSPKLIMSGICFTCIRSLGGIAFIFLGELLESIFEKNEKIKAILGAAGIVLVIAGAGIGARCVIVRAFILSWNPAALYVIAALLIIPGIMMIVRWIGECKILEVIGKNAKLIYLLYFVTGMSELQRIVTDAVFSKTDNNFVTRATGVIVVVALEFVIIYIYRLLLKNRHGKL